MRTPRGSARTATCRDDRRDCGATRTRAQCDGWSRNPSPSCVRLRAHSTVGGDRRHGDGSDVLDRRADVPAPGRACARHWPRCYALDYDAERYQIIVVDDGDDGSAERVLESPVSGDPRVPVRLGTRGRGIGRAPPMPAIAGLRWRTGSSCCSATTTWSWLPLITFDCACRAGTSRRRRRERRVALSAAVIERRRQSPFGRYRIALEHGFQDGGGGRPSRTIRMPADAAGRGRDLSLRRDRFREVSGFDGNCPVAGAEIRFLDAGAGRGSAPAPRHQDPLVQNDNHLTLRITDPGAEQRTDSRVPCSRSRASSARWRGTCGRTADQPPTLLGWCEETAQDGARAPCAPSIAAPVRGPDRGRAPPGAPAAAAVQGANGVYLFRRFRKAWGR